MNSKNRILKNIYVQYSLLFAGASLFWILQFVAFGKTTIWSVDGYCQYYGVLAKMHDLIVSLFSGGGLAFWQWDIGLGSDLLSNMAVVLFDPFAYITALFPKSMMDVAYSFMVVLKLYVAGLIVLKILKYKNKSFNMCLIGAISYAFCAWALATTVHLSFVSQLIVFPLIIWGIDKIWNKERPTLFIVGIFFSATISLYCTYMTAIMAAVHFIVKYFNEREEKTFKYFIEKTLRVVGYSLVGALLAAPVIGATLYALINVSTEGGTTTYYLPKISELLKYIPSYAGFIDINPNYSYVAMNGMLLLAIPVILFFRKRTTAMIMSLVCAVFAFFPIFQSILNGMSYPAGRWCYAMALFLAIALTDSLEVLLDNPSTYKKKINITLIVMLVISVFLIGFLGLTTTGALITVFVNVVFAKLMLKIISNSDDRDKKLDKVKWLVVMNVAIFCFVVFSPNLNGKMDVYLDKGDCYKGYSASSLSEASKIKDNDFYRVGTFWNPWNKENGPVAHTAVDSNLYWGVSSPSIYLSTVDSDWIKYNGELANSGGNFRRMTSLNNDSRCRINFLQGVKYYLSNKDTEDIKNQDVDYDAYVDYGYEKLNNSNININAYKAKTETGLGYVFDSVVSKTDYLKLDPVKREQLLMNSAVVEDNDYKELANLQTTTDKCSFEKATKIPHKIKEYSDLVVLEENKAYIQADNEHFFIRPSQKIKNSELYVVFKGLKKKPYSNNAIFKHAKKKGDALDSVERFNTKIENYTSTDEKDFVIYVSKPGSGEKQVIKGLVNAEDENQGIQGVTDYIVNLGYVKESQDELICTFTNEGKYSYDEIELLAVPTTEYDKQSKKLSEQRLKTTSIKNDVVEGTVDAKQDGLLYLNIIKNDGWSVYIDGKKADKVYQVDTAFTGVKISKGHHKVKLVYSIVWIKYTFVAMILGLLIAIALIIKGFLNKKRKRTRLTQ